MHFKIINPRDISPSVVTLVVALAGLVVIVVPFGFVGLSARQRTRDDGTRYRSRKLIAFTTYFAMILFLTIAFRDLLGNLTMALGVAGAGATFALQEVIRSIAGWFAISFGDFYQVGDRVQPGGTKGAWFRRARYLASLCSMDQGTDRRSSGWRDISYSARHGTVMSSQILRLPWVYLTVR